MKYFLSISIIFNLLFVGWQYKRITEIATRKSRTLVNKDWETVSFRLQRDQVLKSLPNDDNKIVFIGNSHIQYFEWAEAFGRPYIKNRGIGGDVIEGIIQRIPDVINSRTEVLVVSAGINDLAQDKSPDYLKNKMAALITTARKINPDIKIIINSVFPTTNRKQSTGESLMPDIISTNSHYKGLANNYNCVYIDMFTKLGGNEGILEDYHSGDFLHLNALGYKIWVDELKPHIL